MDWYLHELYMRYRQREWEMQTAARPPSQGVRRPRSRIRRRLSLSFVRIGIRLDAETSVAALQFAYSS